MSDYTGHKQTKIGGDTIVEWLLPGIKQEARLYDVELPTDAQIALVVSVMRMHPLLMHASGYDYSELGKPDQKTEHWPIESSIGRYFRDAAREVLDEYQIKKGDT